MARLSIVFCQTRSRTIRRLIAGLCLSVAAFHGHAHADEDSALLSRLRRNTILTSTIPDNGDQNPYAVIVAPVSVGKIVQGDVLVDNFNDSTNLQGLGTTIIDYNPTTRRMTTFAQLPRHLPQCPGGVGLSTAMAMLRSGFVIVGSMPSNDGTTKTKGAGCLMVLDANGQLVDTWAGPDINGPWGNMAVIDNGATASVFVSNAGFDVPDYHVLDEATEKPVIVRKSTVLRLDLTIAPGRPPAISRRTVVGHGFGARADKGVFLIGPTGLVLGRDDVLYVSDAIDNRIVAIDTASRRMTSAGTGREVTRDGLLRRPLAMVGTSDNHLIVANGLNGQLVEIDAGSGRQLVARWVDANKAQTPPGSGDLFGLALTPGGDGIYFVEDEVAMLVVVR